MDFFLSKYTYLLSKWQKTDKRLANIKPAAPEALPGHMGYVVHPAAAVSALGAAPVGHTQNISFTGQDFSF